MQELIAKLAKCARSMKPGALFVTLKQFPPEEAKYFDTVAYVRARRQHPAPTVPQRVM